MQRWSVSVFVMRIDGVKRCGCFYMSGCRQRRQTFEKKEKCELGFSSR